MDDDLCRVIRTKALETAYQQTGMQKSDAADALLETTVELIQQAVSVENGVAFLSLGQNVGELVVGGEHDRVYVPVAGALFQRVPGWSLPQ